MRTIACQTTTRLKLPSPGKNWGRTGFNHLSAGRKGVPRFGGMVSVLASHYTMNAQNPAARRETQQVTDLVGAVRLPPGLRRSAGTDAVTDLLVFRQRGPKRPPPSLTGKVRALSRWPEPCNASTTTSLNTPSWCLENSAPSTQRSPTRRLEDWCFLPRRKSPGSHNPKRRRESTTLHDGTIVDRDEEFAVSSEGSLRPPSMTSSIWTRCVLG